MIAPDQAWRLILDRATPLPTVTLSADKALGHYLAAPVFADRDIPPTDRSAMDGFAVRSDDLQVAPVDLTVLGELAAGSNAEFHVAAGCCVRIYTGACIPPGADAVVMQEDTSPADAILRSSDPPSPGNASRPDAIRILKSVSRGANVFKRGENARQGDTLLTAGIRLDPSGVAVCAAVGCGHVPVHGRPRVSVLSTGTELLAEDSGALPHQTRNSNGPFLCAALAEQDFPIVACETVADRPAEIIAALQRASEKSDTVILTGGISVGKYDPVPEAIRQAGGIIHYHGVAMKPGKPQLFATGPWKSLVFGLPGNPLSAMTGFHELVLPALRRQAGCPSDQCRPTMVVRLAHELSTKGDRLQFVPARLKWTENGAEATAVDVHGTADLVAGSKADGALIVPEGTRRMEAGAFVGFRPWRFLP